MPSKLERAATLGYNKEFLKNLPSSSLDQIIMQKLPEDLDDDFFIKEDVDPKDPFKLGKSKEQKKLSTKFEFLQKNYLEKSEEITKKVKEDE